MRDLRLREWASANPDPKWHCPLCPNEEYVRFGWLLTHMAKHHSEEDLEKFQENSGYLQY